MALSFSNTTTKNGLIQRCELYSGLGDGSISGNATLLAQFTALINSATHKVITMIFDSQDEWDFDDTTITTTYPISTRALVAGQRDYKFSTSTWSLLGVEGGSATANVSIAPLKIKRVDVTYDGVTYYRANPFDPGQTQQGLGNDVNTDGRYSRTNPVYDIGSGAISVYPEAQPADVSAGAQFRVMFSREFTEFVSSDTTKVLCIDTAFAPIVPLIASQEYSMAVDMERADRLEQMAGDYEARLRNYYGRKDEDRVPQLQAGYINYN